MDPMDMDDETYETYQARRLAASIYRREGFHEYADRVERGEADDCSQMRIARWWREPRWPVSPEYEAAWNEAAAARV